MTEKCNLPGDGQRQEYGKEQFFQLIIINHNLVSKFSIFPDFPDNYDSGPEGIILSELFYHEGSFSYHFRQLYIKRITIKVKTLGRQLINALS